MEPLEDRRLLAAGDLVGIDFGPTGDFSPVNWNQSNGGGNVDFILDDLIDESGAATTIDLEVVYDAGNGLGGFPANVDPAGPPTHSNPLDAINGVLVDQTGLEFTFSGLNPGADYEVYVFGGDPINALSQNVTIVGETTIPFTQNWNGNQFVNSQPMSIDPLSSFAE
jgi:hypothetical protein